MAAISESQPFGCPQGRFRKRQSRTCSSSGPARDVRNGQRAGGALAGSSAEPSSARREGEHACCKMGLKGKVYSHPQLQHLITCQRRCQASTATQGVWKTCITCVNRSFNLEM